MLVMAFCGSGCAGFMAGDLRNTRSDHAMPSCGCTNAYYQVLYKSDAEDDCCDKNIAGRVSAATLGIVPTYWTSSVHSEVTVLHDGQSVYAKKYTSRIHKFYGLLWTFVFPFKTMNALRADEGGGLRIKWGVRDRTLWKVVADHGGKPDQYCVQNEESP